MTQKYHQILLLTGLLIIGFGFFGCEGPQGPPGEGVGDVDYQEPDVTLTLPASTDTVYTDTFFVAATATDNVGVDYVEFLLDGSSSLGGDSAAIDDEAPYYLKWTLSGSGHGYGIYPLVARAFDDAGNVGYSTPRIILYLPLPAQQTISYFGIGDESYKTLPDIHNDKYWNVRFTPLDTCQVMEVHFEFRNWDGAIQTTNSGPLTGPCDMNVMLWNSDGRYPDGDPVATRLVSSDNIVFDGGWTIVDFTDIQETLVFNGPFHAGFSPPDADYETLRDNNEGLPIVVNINTVGTTDPLDHNSIEYTTDLGWSTMQADFDYSPDFHIRVRVAYSNGETELVDTNPNRRVTE